MRAGSLQEKAAIEVPSTIAEPDLVKIARAHPCATHPLFQVLRTTRLTHDQAGALLRNYDAHASVLRRLLLKAASIMPDSAVGFVLENVRTEFGAGNYEDRHQLQLLDLACQCGISLKEFNSFPIQPGVKSFIKSVTPLYFPLHQKSHTNEHKAAISAGAITATEILAIDEFESMQVAFKHFGLDKHIWFDHVTVEVEHQAESLALAQHFIDEFDQPSAVLRGLKGVLAANTLLYDGFLAAIRST